MGKKGRLISAFIGSIVILLGTILHFFSETPVAIKSYKDKQQEKVDLVVFSYDRPMQLYACLESMYTYLKNIGDIKVIARASSVPYIEGYDQVMRAFPEVEFHFQGEHPREDFKPLVMKAVYGSPSRYVAFAVDDLIVKDHVDFAVCTEAMQNLNGWGFYLRLGKNIKYSYMTASDASQPPMKAYKQGVYSWIFGKAHGEWKYANSLDMTIFSKEKIKSDLTISSFYSPNSFESAWAQKSKRKKRGLCFEVSKVVNVPLNLVNVSSNRNMHGADALELLKLFQAGLKMDIGPFFLMNNSSPHEEVKPVFIERSSNETYISERR